MQSSLLGAVVFLATVVWASDASIQEISKQSRESIEQAVGNPIPDDKADVIFTRSIHRFRYSAFYPTGKNSEIIRILQVQRLRVVFDELLKTKRIHWLTPESYKKLNLDSTFCRSQQDCHKPRAFYLPLPGLLFLDSNLTDEEAAEALFHEVLHAYQFTYRFPLDLMMASTLADQGKISPSSVYDFLSYYYESQANWQTLRMTQPKAWQAKFQTDVSKVDSFAQTALIIVTHGLSMVVQGTINKQMTKNLPNVDRTRFDGSPLGRFLGGGEAALNFHELHLQNNPSLVMVTPWDSNFHRSYAKAVERTYFGRLDFIFQNQIPDYKLFNPLHNQYYDLIGTEESVCDALPSKALAPDTSPLAFWLGLSANDYRQCPTYAAVGEYLQQIGMDSLFVSPFAQDPQQIDAMADRGSLLEINPNPKSRDSKNLEKDLGIPKNHHRGDSLKYYSRSLLDAKSENDTKKRSPFLIFRGSESSNPNSPDRSHQLTGGEGTTPDIPVLPALPILPQLLVLPDDGS